MNDAEKKNIEETLRYAPIMLATTYTMGAFYKDFAIKYNHGTKLGKKEYVLTNKAEEKPKAKEWSEHKYIHSWDVLGAGYEYIISNEEYLNQPKEIKDAWLSALLLHDIALAYPMFKGKGQDAKYQAFPFSHGAIGMVMLQQRGVTSPQILLPVLMHDIIGCDLFSQIDDEATGSKRFKTDAEILAEPKLQKLPLSVRRRILPLMEQYRNMPAGEQHAVRLGCTLLQEADQIGNLKNYESLLAQSNKPKILACSDDVLRAFDEQRYVKKEDRQSFMDHVLMYLAWPFGDKQNPHSSAYFKCLQHLNILPEILNHAFMLYETDCIVQNKKKNERLKKIKQLALLKRNRKNTKQGRISNLLRSRKRYVTDNVSFTAKQMSELKRMRRQCNEALRKVAEFASSHVQNGQEDTVVSYSNQTDSVQLKNTVAWMKQFYPQTLPTFVAEAKNKPLWFRAQRDRCIFHE